MIPTFEQFKDLAKRYNVIPFARVLMADLHTPVSTYLTLRQEGTPSFLFESVEPDERIGRYSFIGVEPVAMLRARGTHTTLTGWGRAGEGEADVFQVLRRLTGEFRCAPLDDYHGLSGGLVGYLGYDTVRLLEKVPIPLPGVYDEDDAVFGLYPSVVRFDHRAQLLTLLHNVLIDPSVPLRLQFEEGMKMLETMELKLKRPPLAGSLFHVHRDGASDEFDREGFLDAVRRVKAHIHEGDVFQAVLSRRITRTFSGDLFAVYRALRMINPSPYLFYLDCGETKLVGSSPEVLVRARGGVVEVLPIAGTRKRGSDPAADRRMEESLLGDAKELAEHVMLVDLGRNDVGRISEFGSVTVPVFKRVERYSHVMHLVSEVRGRLQKDTSPVDVLAACFPAGTVSGAPKVRAMEIIQQLEPVQRGAYGGGVGYIGFDGTLDTCIAIRTLIAHGEHLKIQAGAGIVADSDPEREYEETVNKSRALLDALEVASGNGSAEVLRRMGAPGR